MQDYEQTWEEFWKDICTNKDGSINLDQVKRELHDYKRLLKNIPEVYCHVTGDSVSKPFADPKVVCDIADRYYQELYEDMYLDEYVGLYELITDTFGVELPDYQFELICNDIEYAAIHIGVPLKRIVQIAKDYYDRVPCCQDDIPACFAYGLHDEGLI
jgi:hypothetical protein